MITPLWHEVNGRPVRIGTAIVERPRPDADFEVVLYLDDPLVINDPENVNVIRDLKRMARRDERRMNRRKGL